MSMFFLLLVSLSEHMPFEAAYAIGFKRLRAAAHLITPATCWAIASRGLPFGLGIATLYGMLFVLLRMEQTALLLGAVALFAVLAAVMMRTRRVDWYARFKQADPVKPEPARVAVDGRGRGS